ncbi:MAG: hypothetical protein COB23_09515 [Methylophaga sp.]|nr:MAG: hypothetical protein COB23_09515 [Methylophaga sp.]
MEKVLNFRAYRPEIDGLRALAVIPVILFHMGADWLPGGYIGVDVFFVISGFLITLIILDEYKRDTFSFANFWLRRVRRILPVVIAMVLVTLVVGNVVLYGPDINNLGNQGIASLLSFANISHWLLAGDYWGQTAESSPFLHTWSLSVEEQFYLFLPLLLVVLLKYLHKQVVFTFSVLVFLSMLLFFYGTQYYSSATFYLLPTRAWELGTGALLAATYFNNPLRFENKQFLAIIGFVAVVLSYFFISGENGISAFLVIPVFSAALIIAFSAEHDGVINRFLSISPIIYVGKISYSLYIWHWPVLVLLKQWYLNRGMEFNILVSIPIILVASVLSYHFIEVPTRRNVKFTPYILYIFIASIAISYIVKNKDHTEDTSFYNATEWHGDLYDVRPMIKDPLERPKGRMQGIVVITKNQEIEAYSDLEAYYKGGIRRLHGTKTPDIVVLGDSHALMWAKVLDDGAKELGKSISFYSAAGQPTFFEIPVKKSNPTSIFSSDERYAFESAKVSFLEKWKPKVVVISTRWSDNNDVQEMEDLIQYLGSIGTKVLFIEQPPELFFGEKNAPKYLSFLGLVPSPKNTKHYVPYIPLEAYQKGLEAVKFITKKYDFCQLITTSDLFLNNDRVLAVDAKDVLYVDDDHLSQQGALKAKARIMESIQEHL